ncbi:UNVERIFIED_ORG: transcriptional regulator [Lacrimispora saccharolytica]
MLYDNVKRVCDEKGISVGKLEKELELSNGSICKWNESEPGIRKVEKVAKYLGVSIEELLK